MIWYQIAHRCWFALKNNQPTNQLYLQAIKCTSKSFWTGKHTIYDEKVKLSSKLRKNENNTDISLYQIYLSKLHERYLEIL